jgi:phosphatidylglycerol:prolipoprotein diacylglycerol transferase
MNLETWQNLPSHISPFLFEIGGFGIRYYSLMYVAAFVTFYILINYRLKTEHFTVPDDFLDQFIVWSAIGVLLGGRLGYAIFYEPGYYLSHPLSIILPFSFSDGFHFTGISGMSYHGGLIGVIVSTVIFCKKYNLNLWHTADLIVVPVPLGYTFGRIGNFLNGELFGRQTELAWGMYFPQDPLQLLRHPSQLYEAFFEGLVLFFILWTIRKSSFFKNNMFSVYLIGYGVFRFFIEFVRQPDDHLEFVFFQFTMGQVLCVAMTGCGIFLFLLLKRQYTATDP